MTRESKRWILVTETMTKKKTKKRKDKDKGKDKDKHTDKYTDKDIRQKRKEATCRPRGLLGRI